jgi:hypothetical protein
MNDLLTVPMEIPDEANIIEPAASVVVRQTQKGKTGEPEILGRLPAR